MIKTIENKTSITKCTYIDCNNDIIKEPLNALHNSGSTVSLQK